MSHDVQTFETALDVIPYGEILSGAVKVWEFASSFGQADPIDLAINWLQEEINELGEARVILRCGNTILLQSGGQSQPMAHTEHLRSPVVHIGEDIRRSWPRPHRRSPEFRKESLLQIT